MNEQQRKQVIVAGVLGALFVAVLVFELTRPAPGLTPEAQKAATGTAKPAGGTAPVAPGTPAPKAPTAEGAKTGHGAAPDMKKDVNIDELLKSIMEVDFDYDKERKPRDPLAPLTDILVSGPDGKVTKGNESVPPLSPGDVMNKIVSGILWDKQRPLAVVDDEVVYPGYEYKDGTRVESIEEDKVVFKVGDALIQVVLKKEL